LAEEDLMLDLHPQAREHFDAQAEALVSNLSTVRPRREEPAGFRAKVYIPNHVTATGEVTEERADLTGDLGFLVTSNADGSVGLYGAHYIALHKLATAVQKAKTLAEVVSVKFVRNQIFEWLKARHRGLTNDSMTAALLMAVDQAVVKHEIWIPVAHLYVQSSFAVGEIQFQTWDETIFDAWQHKQRPPEWTDADRAHLAKWIEQKRKQLQGTAAATVTLVAEPERAIEKALDLADVAIGILRLYADANFFADQTSYCTILGTAHIDSHHLFFMDGKNVLQTDEGHSEKHPHWLIRDEDLLAFRKMGLDKYGEIAAGKERTPFQEEVLSALLLYTRGALKKNLSDRLVYQFAGLESLVIMGDQEMLTQNIRERLAFVLEKTPDRRAAIIEAVTDAYKLRSGFVHHGRPVEDQQVFERFAEHGWNFFVSLANNLHFPTRADFINAIDRIKLS
jgi:hypothetical protein